MSEKNYIERYWRDAKPEDAIKDPPMEARFEGIAFVGKLVGWKGHGQLVWCDENSMWHTHCQVYDAPDPGKGWRLVDPSKESPQDGDEVWSRGEGIWKPRLCPARDFTSVDSYRRRISHTVTYIPFTWEDREQLRGRWVYRDRDDYVLEEVAFKFDSRAFDVVAKHLLDDGWKFCDTKKPVGKEVTQ